MSLRGAAWVKARGRRGNLVALHKHFANPLCV